MLAALAKPRRIKESHRRRRRGASRVWLPGQYFDVETGLNYNVNRYYEPATGRYIQSDPIGLASGLSTYAYAANTPINASDSSGLACNAHGCWNTPEEEAYGIAGDWNNYYRTACANGDPYACRGSQVAHNSDAPGIRGPLTHITNIKLEASLRRNLPGLPCDIASQIVDQEMENIREGLVKARVQQLDGADEDHPRMVSKQSISDFHHQVFQANGASPDAFGGDLWDAFYGPVWSGWLGDRYEWCESPACMHK